jgi:hypothetical protein
MEQEAQKETFLALLEASLKKKRDILIRLCELSKEQEMMITTNKVDDDRFGQIIEEKEIQIQQILKLDEGFEQIYQRVREEIAATPGRYKTEISGLKELISEVTNIGVELQVIERHNKSKMDFYFQSKRKDIKNVKLSSKNLITDHFTDPSR